MTDTAQRVVSYLTARGWTAGRVDRKRGPLRTEDWPGHGVGYADVIAFKPGVGHLHVQSCAHQHWAEHLRKMVERSGYVIDRAWQCRIVVELWGWWPDREEPRREAVVIPPGTPIKGQEVFNA